jgi:hypothetical protein
LPKTVKTSISVPVDLKARMDAVGESVSWSAVACAAFEQRLAEIIKRKGVRDMLDVVARLRASKRQGEDSRYQEGHEAGRAWAEEKAEARELELLEVCRHQIGCQWGAVFDPDRLGGGLPAGEWIYYTMHPNHKDEDDKAMDYWEEVRSRWDDHRDVYYDDVFMKGFVEGAIELWKEVKDKL